MINGIIIDDEEMARSIISHLAANNPNITIQESFQSAVEAIKYLNHSKVDLVFLDIHMPTFTGLDLVQTIKNPPQIILTTSDKSFALEAFEYDCIIDYLSKPVTQERFDKGVEKALMPYQKTMSIHNNSISDDSIDDLYVNIDRRLVKIDIPTINLVEAKGDYILLKTTAKNYLVHTTLKSIEDKLPQDLFFKVHRSYIINTSRIIDIEDSSVLIEKDVIPISRANKPRLMERLNLL